jgi:hypothetical protein
MLPSKSERFRFGPRVHGKEIREMGKRKMKHATLFVTLALIAIPALAQINPLFERRQSALAQTTWKYRPQSTSAMCSIPLGTLMPGCPPVEFWKAGIQVNLNNPDSSVLGWYVTATVLLADGTISTQEWFAKRIIGGSLNGCGTAFLWFGKVPADFLLSSVTISVQTVPVGVVINEASPIRDTVYPAKIS